MVTPSKMLETLEGYLELILFGKLCRVIDDIDVKKRDDRHD